MCIDVNLCVFMNMAVDTNIIKDIPALQEAFLLEVVELAKAYDLLTDASSMLAETSPGGEFAVTTNE